MRVTGVMVGGGALLLSSLVLALSLWQQINVEVDDQVLAREAQVVVTDRQPWVKYDNIAVSGDMLPGEPGYWLRALVDRVNLALIKDPDNRCEALLTLANYRMGMVDELILKDEARLALQTAVKGVYYWEAARNYLTTHDDQRQQHGWLWQQMKIDGDRYLQQLQLMKMTLSEPAHLGIEKLMETVRLGQERVGERVGE